MNTQQDFINEANEGKSIFLTGIPWSWKTYILKQWMEQNLNKKIVVVAPTGIAAINAGWVTIHSAFKLYWDNYHIIRKQEINWENIDVLIIDEISMVSCELFDYMSEVIKKNRYCSDPFWWLQVIAVWDLSQLPPVYDLSKPEVKDRYNSLMKNKWGVLFNLSDAYKWFTEINLTEPQRSKDPKLNDLLIRIREWDMTAVKEFQQWWYSTQFSNKAIHIMPYNYQVDKYNSDRLDKIPWKTYRFKWFIKWEFNANNVLAPMELNVKIWATIMVIKNLENWLVNWDMWEVISIQEKTITIKSFRLEEEFEISLEKWENIHYDQEWNKEVLWKFIQYPLRLWFAITAHKSQWCTLEKIIFHYNSGLSQELIYVALSRGTTYEWIYIAK